MKHFQLFDRSKGAIMRRAERLTYRQLRKTHKETKP